MFIASEDRQTDLVSSFADSSAMFSFLKSKPKAVSSEHGARQQPAPDDDAWHVGAIGSAGDGDGGYDDVSLGDANGGLPAGGGASPQIGRAHV